MESICKIKVRYDEIGLYGMAHHSSFSSWLDCAISNLLAENGIKVKELEARGVYFPTYKSSIRFIKPVFCDDEITIKTSISTLTYATITFEYDFYKENELVATGSSVHIFANKELKPTSARKIDPAIYEGLKKYIKN